MPPAEFRTGLILPRKHGVGVEQALEG